MPLFLWAYVLSLLLQNTFYATGQVTREVQNSYCSDECDCTLGAMNCTFQELKDVPNGTFPFITTLYLNDNDFTRLENDSFNGFTRLRYLYLQRNGIDNIQRGSFENLTLLVLDLSDNQITTISYVVMSVADILLLDRNPIAMEQDTRGPYMKKDLYTFSLVECGLSQISRRFVSAFNGVQELLLSGNVIKTYEGAFQDIKAFANLDLSGNNISKVEGVDALAGPNYYILNLSGNPLDILDMNSLKNLVVYHKLDISDTPLVCECQHWDVFWWAKSKYVNLEDDCNGTSPCVFTTTPRTTTTAAPLPLKGPNKVIIALISVGVACVILVLWKVALFAIYKKPFCENIAYKDDETV